MTVILKWLVDDAVAEKVIQTDCLIEEEEVECRPERVQNSILDDNVDVCLIRKYFTNDAWKVVQDVLQLKEINTTWTCQICNSEVSLDCVCCESCLCWYHYKCVGLVTKPKMKNWYCRQCYLAKL